MCATVLPQQLPVNQQLAVLNVQLASVEVTAMKTWMNVSKTLVVPMLAATIQLVPSAVTVMKATYSITSLHVLVGNGGPHSKFDYTGVIIQVRACVRACVHACLRSIEHVRPS